MAARYWVGGSGTWDGSSTANWSATSGGAAGASAPTSADNVVIDTASGTGTITTAAGAVCIGANMNSSTISVVLGANLTMAGSYTFTQGTLSLQTFILSCSAFLTTNSNARTVAFGTGSITLTGNATVIWDTSISTNLTITGTPVVNATYSGATGTRTLSFANTSGGSAATSVSANITAGTDSVALYGAAIQSVNFTGFSGTWAATGSTKMFYGNLTLSTGMTVAASTAALVFVGTTGTQSITTNGKTVDAPMTFNGVGGTFRLVDALTQGSTRTFTITNGTVQLKAGTTNTVGSFATGAGTTQRFLQSDTPGTQATISDSSGTNTATYLTIRDTAATGGATWNAFAANNNVNAGNNSGWNFGYTPQFAYEYPTQLRSFTERICF